MTLNVNGFFPGELAPNETIAGCIEIFENVWPNPDETIENIENVCADPESGINWQKASTFGNGAFQDHRTNMHCGITELGMLTNNPVVQNIHNQFNMLLLSSTIPYANRYGIEESLWHEDYMFLRYSGGQEYKAHYDAGGPAANRAISALCYLNDNYKGGEIEFTNFHVKIKPEPGMLILFPSTYPYRHIAHPVESGTKYNLVSWIRSN